MGRSIGASASASADMVGDFTASEVGRALTLRGPIQEDESRVQVEGEADFEAALSLSMNKKREDVVKAM